MGDTMRNIPDDLSRLEHELQSLLSRFGIDVTGIDVFHSRGGNDQVRDTNISIQGITKVSKITESE